MLQTTPDQLNQKHTSSIENTESKFDEATMPPSVNELDVWFPRVISNWIDLKNKDGTIQSLYDHWILARDASPPRRRWSVIRNVLHWVN